jgi:hypothetical protein
MNPMNADAVRFLRESAAVRGASLVAVRPWASGFRLHTPPSHCAALLLLAAFVAPAQINIGGVADRATYTTQVTFSVTNTAGYTYAARLEGKPVPVGEPVVLQNCGYQELSVWATNIVTSATTNRLVRFIVRTAERGSTENGLPPWTPYPTIPSAAAEFASAQLRIVAPDSFPAGMEIPVVAWVESDAGSAVRVNGEVTAPDQAGFKVFRGVGSGFLHATHPPGTLSYQPSIGGLTTNLAISVETTTDWTSLGGTVAGHVNLPAGSRITVTNQLTIPAGATLTIGEGSVVRLGSGVGIKLDGTMRVNGTRERPVIFTPAEPSQPWGGFLLELSSSELTASATIFTGSGAEPNWFGANGRPSSHRKEQALFYCTNAPMLRLTDCAAIRLAGQLGHSVNGGRFTLDHFLMQRCTSGGEFTGSSWSVNDSAFIECPDDSAGFVDGDNDALYFVNGTHGFTNTLIGWTKDDGVDSGAGGSGTLTFQSCWFEAIFHEGNSLSGTGKNVTHHDGVFMNCGQALEAGYDGPNGVLVHCLSTGNLIGARFGDNYDWTYNGSLRATNSLLLYNLRDVWGMNWDDWTYRTNQMDIRSNYLTATDPRWPGNCVWDAGTDGPRLVDFLNVPASSVVGVGFAVRTNRLDSSALTNGVPVRLSRFATAPVSVGYVAEAAVGELARGRLDFLPGQTVQTLALSLADPFAHEWVSVRLTASQGTEVTGLAEVFALTPSSLPDAPVVLIQEGATWRYLDAGTNLGAAWTAPDFVASAWPAGPAQLGFGDGDEVTLVNSNRQVTTYFRHSFTVPDPGVFTNLTVALLRDDGGIVHLNGTEVFRSNIRAGVVDFSTLATNALAEDELTRFYSNSVSPASLVAGTNVVAVEIHQSSATSSDLSFDLRLTGHSRPVPILLRWAVLRGQLLLYWGGDGQTLESAATPAGEWLPAPERGNPVVVAPTDAGRFFRLRE